MTKQYMYAGMTVVIWATMATVVKILLADIPDLQALAISGFFAALFFLIINIITGKLKLFKKYGFKDYCKMGGLGFLGLFLYAALYFRGIRLLTSQEACIINYLWPIMVLVFSCLLLKEKFTVKKIVAMFVSFAGIIVLVLGNGAGSSSNQMTGIILCVCAAVCYGLFCVLNKKANYDQNVQMMVTWIIVMISAGVLGLLTEHWVPVMGMQWAGLIWLGVVVKAIAYFLWALVLNGAKNTAKIANIAYLTPFISILISAIVLKEHLHFTALIAIVLIVGGIMIQNLQLKPHKRKQGKELYHEPDHVQRENA